MRSHAGFIPINEWRSTSLPFTAMASEDWIETDEPLTAGCCRRAERKGRNLSVRRGCSEMRPETAEV